MQVFSYVCECLATCVRVFEAIQLEMGRLQCYWSQNFISQPMTISNPTPSALTLLLLTQAPGPAQP